MKDKSLYTSRIVRLPIEIFEIAYWVHATDKNKVKITEILIEGYNIRADKNDENVIVVLFKDCLNDTKYAYKWSDVRILHNYSDAERLVQKINQETIAFPVSKPQYKEE